MLEQGDGAIPTAQGGRHASGHFVSHVCHRWVETLGAGARICGPVVTIIGALLLPQTSYPETRLTWSRNRRVRLRGDELLLGSHGPAARSARAAAARRVPAEGNIRRGHPACGVTWSRGLRWGTAWRRGWRAAARRGRR